MSHLHPVHQTLKEHFIAQFGPDYVFNWAEIGVFEGTYSVTLLENLRTDKGWLVDSWEFTPTQGDAGRDQANWDEVARKTMERLRPYENARVIRMRSEDAYKIIPKGLDFVYIDASHYYEKVREDIVFWFPTVHVGGWVTGDDYSYDTVQKAVHEFMIANPHFKLNVLGSQWWFVKHTDDFVNILDNNVSPKGVSQ
jgi:hypothetical protein